jgi:thioredoxin 1
MTDRRLRFFVVHRFAQIYKDARFYKFDVDELPEIAQKLNVRAMPTFFFYKDGKEVQQIVGASIKELEAAIQTGVE